MSNLITKRKISIFWLPLAATWLMMAFEGPFLAAIIARLAEPKFNLAANFYLLNPNQRARHKMTEKWEM
ncbi:MAG: hypothetical protein KAV45_04180 [Calditrichia bacterium]|nr:hypothetical protein [Calditrichia bacterium]